MTSNLGVEVIRTKVLILPIACFAEPNPSVNWLINAAIRIIEAKKPAFSGTTLSHILSMLFISSRMGIVTALSNKKEYTFYFILLCAVHWKKICTCEKYNYRRNECE